jgi:epoxyqueuosine reductase
VDADARAPALVDVDRRVREHAFALGFDVVGVARADEPLGVEHDRYQAFIERGMHGRMGYLARHADVRRRLDTSAILEGARSVVCVGELYARSPSDEDRDAPLARAMARYARGQDYHNHVRRRLKRLAAFICDLGPGVRARALCDIEPVLERAWAVRAGIGFVGKNGLVITPGKGSYQILGEVVTTIELTPDTPMNERCGACTRCLDACPTSAFVAPFVLDPTRCIAYMTIEDPEPASANDRASIGEHLFGCDVCQEVCPYNRTAPPPAPQTAPFHPLAQWDRMTLTDLCELDEATWDERFRGTPLRRPRRAGIARNAVIVAINRLRSGAVGRAAEDARRALEAALRHDDPTVRRIASEGAATLCEGGASLEGIEVPGAERGSLDAPPRDTRDHGQSEGSDVEMPAVLPPVFARRS